MGNLLLEFYFSSRRRHTRFDCDWSSDVCSSDLNSVLAVIKVGPEDALLGILPMFHVLAQMANLFLPLFNGCRVVYLETLNTTELQIGRSTRLNSSHSQISYAVLCLKKNKSDNYL